MSPQPSPQSGAGSSTSSFCFPRRALLQVSSRKSCDHVGSVITAAGTHPRVDQRLLCSPESDRGCAPNHRQIFGPNSDMRVTWLSWSSIRIFVERIDEEKTMVEKSSPTRGLRPVSY